MVEYGTTLSTIEGGGARWGGQEDVLDEREDSWSIERPGWQHIPLMPVAPT